MGAMAEGWLPPTAPGAKPAPRFDTPAQQPAEAPEPTFVRASPPAPGERNRTAVWAVALGVTGLVGLVISLGALFVFTLPCSIAAWILGARARKAIASGATTEGEGQATAALWLGRIGVIVGVAAMVVFILLVVTGVDLEQLREDLERELEERRERQDDGGDGGGGGGVRAGLEHARSAVAAWVAR